MNLIERSSSKFLCSSENTCLLVTVFFYSNSYTVHCSNVPSSNTGRLKNTYHSRCSNAVLFDPVTCFDRQNVKLNCSHL